MSKATKWHRVSPTRWRNGPLRVYANFDGTRWFAGLMRGRGRVIIEMDISYLTPEAAMKAADKWAARMLKALRKLEGK